ncbi:MAG: SatD family protein [Saccharofermentanales bacterium]|jgi:predicted DNA-binding protein YlxM (UPF0122 family)
MDRYVAIIADIKKSKSTQNRDIIQEKIRHTLNRVNEKYEDVIASKFTVSSGDSFQGLLKNGNQVMNIILEIDLELYPELFAASHHSGIRYGIGIGTLDTELYEEDSNLVDGNAYHMARNSVDAVKKSESSRERIVTNFRVSKEGEEDKEDLHLMNSLLSLVSIIKNKWTEDQARVIRMYIENDYGQLPTADKLEKSQSTISRSLERSSFYSIKESIDALNQSIEKERAE